MSKLPLGAALFAVILTVTVASPTASQPLTPGSSRALIIVGLSGDAAHDLTFRATAGRWRDWLTGPLGFPEGDVRTLSGVGTKAGDAPATRDSILKEVEALVNKARGEDRTWVFVLGHANVEEGHGFLHLPGPDLVDDDFALAFKDLAGVEQVFWMTTAGSGWFLPSLSKAGRIVVAATERDKEFNETEFPHALAEISTQPKDRLDANHDGQVSVQEAFEATVRTVEERFAADKRLPTEHAQLDDNGDGVGTEVKPQTRPKVVDGLLASKTFLPRSK